MKCPMCWNAIGCPIHAPPFSESSDNEEVDNGELQVRSMLLIEDNGNDVELEAVKRTTRPSRKKM